MSNEYTGVADWYRWDVTPIERKTGIRNSGARYWVIRDGLCGSGGVALRFLHVDAAGRGLPAMPAWLRLGDAPAGRLLHLVAGATAGARVTRARFPALVIRHGVLEIRFSRMPVARWKSTGAISDLDEVAEPVARLVAVCLVPMVAFEDRYRIQAHGELAPAG